MHESPHVIPELRQAISDVSTTLVTGTTPGKPADPNIPKFLTGVITAVASDSCTVEFASDPSLPNDVKSGIPYALTGRTLLVDDVVLVLQTRNQRFVIAAISH